MDKKIVFLVLISAIALSGCAEKPLRNSIQTYTETKVDEIKDIDKNAGEIKIDTEKPQKPADNLMDTEVNKDQKKVLTVKPTEVVTGIQPELAKGQKLDFNILNKLNNTKYSWWITLNKEHKPTGIPETARKIIDKYNGIYIGDTSKKVVYLTFDEGYENGFTPKILDTLKENQVKTIFFVTSPFIKGHPDLVKRMLEEGHLVGNHSITHPSLPKVSNTTLENELYGLEKQFTELTGKGMKYMRPPMGEYSEKVLAAASTLGYKTVFWSFAYADFDITKQKGADHAYKTVMDNIHNGAIILLHAVSKDNAEALDRIIKGIRTEGYEIRQLD